LHNGIVKVWKQYDEWRTYIPGENGG